MKKIKVLMFGWEFPPHISGGLGTACYGLSKALSASDAEITFVLPRTIGDYENAPVKIMGPSDVVEEVVHERTVEEMVEETMNQMKIMKVDSAIHPYMDDKTYAEYLANIYRRRQEGRIKEGSFHHPFNNFNYEGDLMSEVARFSLIGKHIAKQVECDVIHAHDWMAFQAGVEAKRATHRPLIVHVHATEFDRTGNHCNPEIFAIEKLGMDMADRIIAVSKRTAAQLVEKYSQDPRKIEVVYNGVDKSEVRGINTIITRSAFHNDKLVLFLGRITGQKGPEYFVKTAAQVAKKMKNVRFVMAGNGDLAPKMIELMATHRLQDRFHFTGFLGELQRDKLYSMSDLFIMPSVSEPFGIVPLEALKHRIPIIISKQSGVSEVLENVSKVDFWDIDAMSDEIVKLLNDPAYAKDQVEKSYKELEGISWDKAASEVLDVYRSVL